MAIIGIKAIEAKSDQLNAIDLVSEITFTVRKVEYFPNNINQHVHMHLEGQEGRPYKPSKGMLRGLVSDDVWTPNTENWAGKKIKLFCNSSVKWGGEEVGGIQISGVEGITSPFSFILKINRTQSVKHTFFPILSDSEVKKEYIFNQWEASINKAKNISDIGDILKKLKLEFPEKLSELVLVATKAKEKLKNDNT